MNITVIQAEGDADTLIASTAVLMSAQKQSVTVVATDTDVLTLLVSRAEVSYDLYMLMMSVSKSMSKIHNISDIQEKIGELKDVLLFAHAISGCDTTSSLYRKGKKKTFKLLQNNPHLRQTVSVFNNSCASHEQIGNAGEIFVLNLYDESGMYNDLDELRYFTYKQTIANQSVSMNFQLASLPPTSDAVRQHSYRAYLQVQSWLGNNLSPCDWGWSQSGNSLVPVTTLLPAAPDNLLHLISCGCKKGCEGWCDCRKAGLICSAMCRRCRGISCGNIFVQEGDGDIECDS